MECDNQAISSILLHNNFLLLVALHRALLASILESVFKYTWVKGSKRQKKDTTSQLGVPPKLKSSELPETSRNTFLTSEQSLLTKIATKGWSGSNFRLHFDPLNGNPQS